MFSKRSAECFHCQSSFDSVRSSWCDCVQRTRSLVCPSCGRCSCSAPLSWQFEHGSNTPRPLASGNSVAAAAAGRKTGEDASHRARILIVDDSKFVQLLAKEGLSDEFEVIIAKDGVEGLALARELRPQIVVTDALMPALDGRELCRILKNDPETRGIQVILMTSLYTSLRHEHEAINSFGADLFLRKPFTITQLRTLIGTLVSSEPASTIAGAGRQPHDENVPA
ncbi:MAG: response regulator [Thermoanaerobaculia bacterium]